MIFGRTKGYLLTEQTAHDAVDGLAEIACDITGAAQGAGVSLIDSGGKRVSVGATDPGVLGADLLGHIQAGDTPQRISGEVKASLAERNTVGVARGILMERFNLDRQAALHHLIKLATDANTTIGLMPAMISERQDGSHPSGDA